MAVELKAALKKIEAKSAKEIVRNHLPPPEILREFSRPSSIDKDIRKEQAVDRPGMMFISTLYKGKHVLVPIGHPIGRQSEVTDPSKADYPRGVFEGLSIYGDSLILFPDKMRRLERSLMGRGYRDLVNIERFAQEIIVTAEVNAETTTFTPDGQQVRAYGRPMIGFDEGPIGIGIHRNRRLYQAVGFSRMNKYLDTGRPLKVVSSEKWKRWKKLGGKFSDSYGEASVIGDIAKNLGGDEALFLSGVSEGRRSTPRSNEWCDGVGEEIIFRKGNTIIVLPSDNGRLGGTSLAHFERFTAHELKFDVQTRVVTLDDVLKGKFDAMYLIGNAVELTPVGMIAHYKNTPSSKEKPDLVVLPNVDNGIVHPIDQQITTYYQDQLWGRRVSSNKELRTPINLQRGQEMRVELMNAYPGWF